jgi:lysylphosphatidylglycerol synthetase-like protein (DUF2156 family)
MALHTVPDPASVFDELQFATLLGSSVDYYWPSYCAMIVYVGIVVRRFLSKPALAPSRERPAAWLPLVFGTWAFQACRLVLGAYETGTTAFMVLEMATAIATLAVILALVSSLVLLASVVGGERTQDPQFSIVTSLVMIAAVLLDFAALWNWFSVNLAYRIWEQFKH